MVKFRCPMCKQKIGVPMAFAGHKVKCPKCQAAVSVPLPQAAGVSAAAAGEGEGHSALGALAAMTQQSLDQAVEVPLRDTAPADVEERRRSQPKRGSSIGPTPEMDSEHADEPVIDDTEALVAAVAESEEQQRHAPAEPEAVISTIAPGPPPEPSAQPALGRGHLHRVKLRVPGYWFLLTCGWIAAAVAALSLIFGLGGAVVDLVKIIRLQDAEMAGLVGAAAMAKFLTLLAIACVGAMLAAIALVVRRTAINTWLLRQQIIGH